MGRQVRLPLPLPSLPGRQRDVPLGTDQPEWHARGQEHSSLPDSSGGQVRCRAGARSDCGGGDHRRRRLLCVSSGRERHQGRRSTTRDLKRSTTQRSMDAEQSWSYPLADATVPEEDELRDLSPERRSYAAGLEVEREVLELVDLGVAHAWPDSWPGSTARRCSNQADRFRLPGERGAERVNASAPGNSLAGV